MRTIVSQYLDHGLSRRGFLKRMTALGFTAAAAEAVLEPLEASERAGETALGALDAVSVEGTGAELVVAQAKAAGARYLFTNPGSVEAPFFDAFSDTSGMQLIMGLHEGVVTSMADGYYKATLEPVFVNVHVVAGTAQMAGQLYNCHRDGSALVVTAGLGDNEVWSDDAILSPRPGFNQKDINRQFTKFSWEAREAESLALMLRRAFKVAATEPGGPTNLALSSDALAKPGVRATVLPAERFLIRGRTRADEAAIEKAARRLVEAGRPALLAGDGVWKAGAQDTLLKLAEMLGAPVFVERWQAFQNFPSHHPLNVGYFSASSDYVQGADVLLSVGARDFGGRRPPSGPDVPSGAAILRIGLDTDAMGRTNATDVALVGDVTETLEDLTEAIRGLVTEARLAETARSRSDEVSRFTAARRAEAEAAAGAHAGATPIHPEEVGATLAAGLDPDAILVDENLTGRYGPMRFGHREGERMWVHNSGHALGWGLGAAMGMKLGQPNRQVVCSIGDGALMYSAPGFWTQARYQIPVLTVVWNNRNYQIVRHSFHRYGGKTARTGHYPGMYLGDPNIDFVALARSQGVEGERVSNAADLRAGLERGKAATRGGSPYLLEVETARYGPGAESTWYQKYSLADERERKV
jgi:benzoylformate decarboxylase